MDCVVLAAGYATRLYPLTRNYPKPLLEVGGKTILDWLLCDLQLTGQIDRYVVVTNHRFYNVFSAWAETAVVRPEIVDDGTSSNNDRIGAVRDLQYAIDSCGLVRDLLVVAGDNLLDFSLKGFLDYVSVHSCSCTMRYREENVDKLRKSGVAVVGDGDRLLDFEEKPKSPRSCWCTPPFYYYTANDAAMIRTALEDGCGADAPGSLVAWMCRHSPMRSMEMQGCRYDIGDINSYEEVKKNYHGFRDPGNK